MGYPHGCGKPQHHGTDDAVDPVDPVDPVGGELQLPVAPQGHPPAPRARARAPGPRSETPRALSLAPGALGLSLNAQATGRLLGGRTANF